MDGFENPRAMALDKKMGNYAVFFLSCLAIWLVIGPLAPTWSGYAALSEMVGGEVSLLRWAVAILFLYFAGIAREKNDLRHTLHGMIDLINRQLYGEDYREARQTVDLLIRSLAHEKEELRESALSGLRKLTGQDIGEDRAAWESWWSEHRATFRRPVVERPADADA